MAKLTFYGATEGVTGSNYLLETDAATILLDCGLFQGRREEEKANEDPLPFDVNRLDAVVLSHAHLDHSGRLPKLVADGYNGPLFMTSPTQDLLEIMLKDAASLQQRDAEWENKKLRRAGKDEIEPLYTIEHVETALALCEGIAYGRRQQVADGIEVCFRDAGHILGSAIVELFITEAGKEKKLVFRATLAMVAWHCYVIRKSLNRQMCYYWSRPMATVITGQWMKPWKSLKLLFSRHQKTAAIF